MPHRPDRERYSIQNTRRSPAAGTPTSRRGEKWPRNTSIPATVTHPGLPVTYYDLGLCTAQNPTAPHTLPAAAQYCGMFKTPTLRNVATRQAFFHNGVFHTLTDLLNWYNTRDTNPAARYPTVNGVVRKFNDLPTVYCANIDP